MKKIFVLVVLAIALGGCKVTSPLTGIIYDIDPSWNVTIVDAPTE